MADKDEVEPTEESDATDPSSFDASSDADRDETPGNEDDFDAIVADVEVDESADDESADDEDDSEAAVVGAGGSTAIAGVAGSAGARRAARAPKSAATNKRDQVEKPERTTPAKFVRQSVGELRKVVYPTGQQLMNYFVVVLVFVLFIIAYVSLLDLGMGQAIFAIFS